MFTRYDEHPVILRYRRCTIGSIASGQSRVDSLLLGASLGSNGVATGLQSNIPKVLRTPSLVQHILPALVEQSLLYDHESHPKY